MSASTLMTLSNGVVSTSPEPDEITTSTRRLPRLRASTSVINMHFQREDDVRRSLRTAERAGVRLDGNQIHLRNSFSYQPPTWPERLVLYALATIAREQGKLSDHPWALQRRPVLAGEVARVRIDHPGISEIARVVGYSTASGGRLPGKYRDPLAKALEDLCEHSRLIPLPVLVKVDGKFVEDVEIHKDLLVRAAGTLGLKRVYLDLHPALVVSHLRSWVPIDGMAARYEKARAAVGLNRMRDELATCDEYLRWLAIANLPKGRDAVPAQVKYDRFAHTIGLGNLIRRRRTADLEQRVDDALTFCREMGSLIDAMLDNGVWRFSLPHPDLTKDDVAEPICPVAAVA